MKKKFIAFLLLFALFFNIAHATIISIEDDCHNETAHEYILEQSEPSDCGDLCELHHLFHFMGILDDTFYTAQPLQTQEHFGQRAVLYTPPFQKTSFKPPIV